MGFTALCTRFKILPKIFDGLGHGGRWSATETVFLVAVSCSGLWTCPSLCEDCCNSWSHQVADPKQSPHTQHSDGSKLQVMIQTDNSSVDVHFLSNESSADTAASYSCYMAFTACLHYSLLPPSTCRLCSHSPWRAFTSIIPVLSAPAHYALQEEMTQSFSFSVNFAFYICLYIIESYYAEIIVPSRAENNYYTHYWLFFD